MRNKILTAMFIVYILIFSVGSLVMKDRAFSDMENRNLEQLPEFSMKALLDGSLTEDFESYMSDQIIFKDTLVRLKVTGNRCLNQSLINGVYFAEDDMLIQDYAKPYNQLSRNVEYVNEFADNHPELSCTWFLIPNACYIYEDRLPAYASCYDQSEVMAYMYGNVSDRISVADCSGQLMDARDEYIYYRTDHHWTMYGAYIGYTVLAEALGLEANQKEGYEVSVGSREFYGTLYSNAPTFTQTPDEIILFEKSDRSYSVEYMDENVVSDSLYNYDNLNIKDKYTTYLDGNHALIKITGTNADKESLTEESYTAADRLLVVKDSYAHCLLPLLAGHYDEIYIVDLRYYHESVSELAKERGISQVVFINNLEFLSTDNNFLWLQ